MNTEEQNFRTKKDVERAQRAAAIVEAKQADFERARGALDAADGACAEDPTEGRFARAKEARCLFEDAEHDLALARAHAAKIEGEIAAAEVDAIRQEIERREAVLTEIVDGDARLMAVEIGTLSAALHVRTLERRDKRRAEIDELNALRCRVGQPAQDRPTDGALNAAFASLVRLGWAVQAGSGWEGGGGFFVPPRFLDQIVRSNSARSAAQSIGAEVEELRTCLEMRHRALEQRHGIVSGATAKVAVALLAVLSAVTMAGG